MATYYVKNGGSDSASGLSDALAWASIEPKVNQFAFQSDDICLFKRGSIWRMSSARFYPVAGTVGNPVTYGAYDTGADPIISGADLVATWTNESGNLWYATCASAPFWVFMDNNIGDWKTTKVGLVNEYDWWYDTANTRLYVFAATDPDTRYTAPGIEKTVTGALCCPDMDNIVLDGITLEKANSYIFSENYPGDHWEIKNCTLQYTSDGMLLGNGGAYTDWKIHDNTIRYIANVGLGPGWAGSSVKIYRNNIYEIDKSLYPLVGSNAWTAGIKLFAENVSNAMNDSDIYENYIHDCGAGISGYGGGRGSGVWIDTVYPNTSNPILIHHNFFYNLNGDAVFIEISSDSRIYGNVAWNCGICPGTESDFWAPAGIEVVSRQPFTTERNLVYNNTIYGGRIGIKTCVSDPGTGLRLNDNIFKNNIVVAQTEHGLAAFEGGDNVDHGSGNVYEYNCFGVEATNFIEWGADVYKSTYDAWETAYGDSTHSIETDPLFTDALNGDFTLQATSPCIDAGADLGATYQQGLGAESVWPNAVVKVDQETHATS